MQKRKSILDYIFILRPMLFLPGWSTFLAGYLINSRSSVFLASYNFLPLDYSAVFAGMAAFGAAMGASFLLNQLRDIESDRENKKLFFLADGIISPKAAFLETGILTLFSFSLSAILGVDLFILVLLFFILTGYLYNFKPFSLKDRPIGSLLANGLMGALAFACGWLLRTGHLDGRLITDLFPYLFLNIALYLFTTLPDVEGDRKINKKTLAVILGVRNVIFIALFCFLLSVIFALVNKDIFIGFILFLSAPQFIRLVFFQNVKYTIKTTKYTILFFSLAICLKIPFYALVISGIIVLTKWYYKRRFNYDYPNFKGV